MEKLSETEFYFIFQPIIGLNETDLEWMFYECDNIEDGGEEE
jgi:hypothetical protein